MPFITEELWQTVAPLAGKRANRSRFSLTRSGFELDSAASTQIATLEALVESCRLLRGQMGVSPAARVAGLVAGDVTKVGVGALLPYLPALAKLSSVEIVTSCRPPMRRCRWSASFA